MTSISPPFPPRDVGPDRKFSWLGSAQRYPGCTLLSHFHGLAPAYRTLCEAQQALRLAAVAPGKLFWLPEASLHVTIFDLVNEGQRAPGLWPQEPPLELPMQMPMAQACQRVAAALRGFDARGLEPIRLAPDPQALHALQRDDGHVTCGLQWQARDAAEERKLRGLRDRLADHLGLRRPGHETYQFHTTLVYQIDWFDADEIDAWRRSLHDVAHGVAQQLPQVELGPPEFCVFETMCAFETQFMLDAAGAD